MKISIDKLKINPEYERLVPALSTSDYETLRDSLDKFGFREAYPVVINKNNEILDGHHRYKICKEIGLTEIPVQIEEFENKLDEKEWVIRTNIARRQLNTAQKGELFLVILEIEREKAKKRINEGRKIGGLTAGRGRPKDEDSSPMETIGELSKEKGEAVEIAAKKVGINKGTGYQVLKIKKAAEEHDEVKKSWQDAVNGKKSVAKVYKEVVSIEKKKEIEKRVENINYNFSENVKLGDAKDLIKDIEDNSVDLILTDPPYFLSEGKTDIKFKDRSDIKRDQGDWDKQKIEILLELLPDMYRVLRDGGSIYIMTQDSLIGLLQNELSKAGFNPHATIVWHKTNPPPGAVRTQFCSSCEYIIFATKGEKHTFNVEDGWNRHNFIEGPICMGNERYYNHPTQKPLYLFEKLMKISSNRGDTVLDPFAGTGTTGVAAKKLGRNFILFEKEKEYVNIIKARLSDE